MAFWKAKSKKLADEKARLTLSQDEVRRRATILVIDDDATAFPVELLRAEGYNIQHWDTLKNLRNLEEGQFAIIVLDIYGITPEGLSQNDGIGVLEHLKKVNPAQIVIAYSGKKFDLRHERFWRIADDYLGKPTDLLVAKAKIDALLREKYTAEYYWNTLVSYLRSQGLTSRQLEKLETAVARAVAQEKPVSESDVAGILQVGKDIVATAWIITQVILNFTK